MRISDWSSDVRSSDLRPGVVVGALNVCLVCCRLEVVSIGLKRSLQMNNSQSVSRKGRLPKSRRVAQKLAPLVVALGMALPVSSVNATGWPVADISHTIQNIFTQRSEERRVGK